MAKSNPDKILTLHPQGKNGVNMDKDKYDVIKAAILDLLEDGVERKPMQMLNEVADRLAGQVEGSIGWYAETVKLDLEARGVIEHDRKKGLLQLAKK